MPQQIAVGVVDDVGVGPPQRIDLARGLVEERMMIPARDFAQRVGAGNHVRPRVVAEGGFPAEGFGDGGAIAEIVVGVAGGVSDRVLLRQDAPLAVVRLHPGISRRIDVRDLPLARHAVACLIGAPEGIDLIRLAPVFVVLDEEVGEAARVDDGLKQPVAGTVSELPGGVDVRVKAGGGVGDGFGDEAIGVVVSEVNPPIAECDMAQETTVKIELMNTTGGVDDTGEIIAVLVPDHSNSIAVEILNLVEPPG